MVEFKNVTVLSHPLISHKVAILRDRNTGMKEFRENVEELAMLMGYESMRDLQTVPVQVETPIEVTTERKIPEGSVVIVPILRAGLGMVNGIHNLFPNAKVGHIGVYRDEETLSAHEYYCKLPDGIEDKIVYVLDAMLASGACACESISILKKRGCKNIKFMSIVASPEGVTRLAKTHPDVQIYLATLDEGINSSGYILPGLGDAGDRMFGTK